MVKKINAYIAHTLNLRFEVLTRLTPMIRRVGIEDKNPFYTKRGKPSRKEVKIADEITKKGINPRDDKRWMERVKKKSRWIVTRDLGEIDKADIIIAYMFDVSAGTTCEIFYGGKIKCKPVFLLTRPDSEICRHPWLKESCRYGGVFTNLVELEIALSKFVKRYKNE